MGNGDNQIASVGLLIVTVLVAMGFSFALTFSAMPPRDGYPVLLIASPWSLGAETIARENGGLPLSPWPSRRFAVLASFEGSIPLQDLQRQGVWIIADGEKVAEICGVS